MTRFIKPILIVSILVVVGAYGADWLVQESRKKHAQESLNKFSASNVEVSEIKIEAGPSLTFNTVGGRSHQIDVNIRGNIRNLSKFDALEEVGLKIIAEDCSSGSKCIRAGETIARFRPNVPAGQIRTFEATATFSNIPTARTMFYVRFDYGCAGLCPSQAWYRG